MKSRPQDLQEYYRLGIIAKNTLTILTRFISRWNDLSAEQEAALGATLDHLADVHEGFRLGLRACDVETLDEMRYLVERVLVDWRWLESLQWQAIRPSEIDLPRRQLMAFAHAHLSLAMLPRLPKSQVTFPRARPSYADIPVPTSGAEIVSRLEELERVIYRILGGARDRVEHDSLRRTYGFFESSAWLVTNHRHKFLDA